jgi:outer membrane protein OmpA-like peptidoglycan-associated protein
MKTAYSRVVWTVGLLGVSAAALAGEPKPSAPQEPAGFITGAVIGGFAAGPVGAVLGAGLGTWLGNRVHRAGEATKAEGQVAELEKDRGQLLADEARLKAENASLLTDKGDLAETNRTLTARLDELSHRVEAAQASGDDATRSEASRILNGLEGDVLFRTGSAEIAPEMASGIAVLAQAVAKSPAVKVRLDGYADPRGTADANLKLSEARANAVRDLFLAAGVGDASLEVNAYGKSQSVAGDGDGDGYALERRVRLTLQADGPAAVAQTTGGEPPMSPPVSANQ